MVALGSITVINQYKNDAYSTTREKQSVIIGNQVKKAMISLQNTNGSKTLDLEDTIAGGAYSLGLGDKIYVFTANTNYSVGLESLGDQYELEGSAEGGDVNIFKRGNKYSLRPS